MLYKSTNMAAAGGCYSSVLQQSWWNNPEKEGILVLEESGERNSPYISSS